MPLFAAAPAVFDAAYALLPLIIFFAISPWRRMPRAIDAVDAAAAIAVAAFDAGCCRFARHTLRFRHDAAADAAAATPFARCRRILIICRLRHIFRLRRDTPPRLYASLRHD